MLQTTKNKSLDVHKTIVTRAINRYLIKYVLLMELGSFIAVIAKAHRRNLSSASSVTFKTSHFYSVTYTLILSSLLRLNLVHDIIPCRFPIEIFITFLDLHAYNVTILFYPFNLKGMLNY
jgi:hypothetical protein